MQIELPFNLEISRQRFEDTFASTASNALYNRGFSSMTNRISPIEAAQVHKLNLSIFCGIPYLEIVL